MLLQQETELLTTSVSLGVIFAQPVKEFGGGLLVSSFMLLPE